MNIKNHQELGVRVVSSDDEEGGNIFMSYLL